MRRPCLAHPASPGRHSRHAATERVPAAARGDMWSSSEGFQGAPPKLGPARSVVLMLAHVEVL